CLEESERTKLYADLIKKNPEEKKRIAYSYIVQRFRTFVSCFIQSHDQKIELSNASKLFKEISNKNELITQLIDDEQHLITRQDELEKKFLNLPSLKGLSLCETIEQLLIANEKEAEQLKKDFGISDKRYWWIKIQMLGKKGAWSILADFGKKPTSPIGYEPFIDICLKYEKPDEAKRYVDKSLYSSKIDDDRLPYMYAKVQMFDEAINSAVKLKSNEALVFIEQKCGPTNINILQKVDVARTKLEQYDDNPFQAVRNIFK
ncbi:unnamed protein product, partial [Didymodactylos carnosus]